MENYLKAKAKLFDLCKIGVINGDDGAYSFLADYAGEKIPIVTFGFGQADYRAENVELRADGAAFDVKIGGEVTRFSVGVPGRFSVMNSLAAIAAAISLKMPAEAVACGLAKVDGVPGRVQLVPNNSGFSVVVDYAHTPDSLRQIIETVREFTAGRVITVFGCGGDRDPFKRPIMGRISGELSDLTVVTSDNPRNEIPEEIIAAVIDGMPVQARFTAITDRREAIEYALKTAGKGDAVIVAGKGHEDYQEFENKRRELFDDAKECVKILNILKKAV